MGTYQQHKFNLCNINALNFWQEIIPGGNRHQPQGGNHKTTSPQKFSHPGNPLTSRSQTCTLTSAPGVVTHYMPKDSHVLQENSNVRYVISLGISPQYVTKRVSSLQTHLKQENPKHTNYVQGPYTPTMILIEVDLKYQTEDLFCLQMKIQKTQVTNQQVPKLIHLMTNLACHLQLHHKRNQYLWA